MALWSRRLSRAPHDSAAADGELGRCVGTAHCAYLNGWRNASPALARGNPGSSRHCSEHDHFEVEGANAARDFLREHGQAAMRCGPSGTRSRSRYVRPNFCRSSAAPSTAPHCAATAPKRERSRVAIRRSRTVFDAPRLHRSFGCMAERRTTNASGVRIASDEHSLTVGPNGPTVLQDAHVVQKMQHFNRERVPERVVHANGSAAHGSSRSPR